MQQAYSNCRTVSETVIPLSTSSDTTTSHRASPGATATWVSVPFFFVFRNTSDTKPETSTTSPCLTSTSLARDRSRKSSSARFERVSINKEGYSPRPSCPISLVRAELVTGSPSAKTESVRSKLSIKRVPAISIVGAALRLPLLCFD